MICADSFSWWIKNLLPQYSKPRRGHRLLLRHIWKGNVKGVSYYLRADLCVTKSLQVQVSSLEGGLVPLRRSLSMWGIISHMSISFYKNFCSGAYTLHLPFDTVHSMFLTSTEDEQIKEERDGIRREERNCQGYIFGLQKQSGENFLAFALDSSHVYGEDETQRRGLLQGQTRRDTTPSTWHGHGHSHSVTHLLNKL